ncbi:uncharacterized protein TM35_000131280 [Trypanosoma theileri]|uniref:Uncharacterized protein n=1 Tax=Trypanosoma theileri TaxID=67003 RepID=A0A1X0NWN9_9TRYP|nr:uncharacterized protein TM35_000131280 [Trypanosoma theileri]ORC89124.1 hypothetical protein TM35_000131280 [Trypanosoma theileri]
MSVGSYKRSQGGEPIFSQATVAPPIPALLRPQFHALSADDVRAIERRLQHTEAARRRDEVIAERCAQRRQQQQEETQRRVEMIERRAARHARAAGIVVERRLKAEFMELGRL